MTDAEQAGNPAAPGHKGARPNVLIIICDDLGYSDLGCYGSEIPTPNVDSLATRGTRFTQFYGYTVCCPSRAALLTGLYPHQAGVGWFVNHGADSRPPGPYQGYLNDTCVTLAEVLKGAGYRTLMSGKWHVGEARPHWPTDRGFDRYFGLISGQSNFFDLEKREWPTVKRQMAFGDQPYDPPKEGFYMTDATADRAVEFLGEDRTGEDPFFLYLSFTAPHSPLHALPEDIARHRGRYRQGWDEVRKKRFERMKSLGILGESAALSARDPEAPPWEEAEDPDLEDLKMAIFAAQVDAMDRGVGRVLSKIREMGEEDNTVVLFLADHGAGAGSVAGQREEKFNRPPYLGGPDSCAAYGAPWANVSTTPWRNFKTSLEEGGISVPMIAVWPGAAARPGGLCHELGHQIDVMPTLLEMTGAEYPRTFRGREIQPWAGESFAPLLWGKERKRRAPLFWEYEGKRAVRDGRWKLIAEREGPWRLYDVAEDRLELRDLAGQQPDRVREMSARYAAWADKCAIRPWSEVSPGLRNLF